MTAVASVVITYFDPRLTLLDRCLFLLREQTVPVEIILAYDGDSVVADPRIDLVFHVVPGGGHKSPNRSFRGGFSQAQTDYILHCPPELLVPRDGVERMIAEHTPGLRDVPIFYGLDERTTRNIDQYPWRENLSCFEALPGFGDFRNPLDMTNRQTRWHSWHLNFSGATREEWLRFDIIPDTADVGKNENWLVNREDAAGVHPKLSSVTVYHQWHPVLA